MGGLFSSKKKKEPEHAEHVLTKKDEAILELKRQRNRLKNYNKGIANVIAVEEEIARKLLQKNDKRRALLALKKRKYQRGLLEQTENQMFNLERMISEIEQVAMDAKVFEALKAGNEALQQLQRETSVEDVEKLMEDSAEAVAAQDQINTMLGGKLSTEEEEAAAKELEALQLELEGAPAPAVTLTDETKGKEEKEKDAKTETKEEDKIERETQQQRDSTPAKVEVAASGSSDNSSSSSKATEAKKPVVVLS